GSARNGGGEGVPGSRDDEAARFLPGEGTVPDGGQRQVGEDPHRARLRAGTGGSSYYRHKIARCCLPRSAQPQERGQLRGAGAVAPTRRSGPTLAVFEAVKTGRAVSPCWPAEGRGARGPHPRPPIAPAPPRPLNSA